MAQVTNRRIDIYIDQQAANDALAQLGRSAQTLTRRIADATARQTELQRRIQQGAAAGRDVSRLQQQYDRLGASITDTTARLNRNRTAQQELSNQIASGLGSTLAQQQAHVRRLNNELRNLSENAPGYAARLEAFQAANATLQQMQERVHGVRGALGRMMDNIRGVSVGVVIGNIATRLLQQAKQFLEDIVTNNAAVSDELSDIEKTTNLTGDQVKKVNQELEKLDTRTSNTKLRQLAAEAGKLGNESVADVKRFVEEANIIDVALGEDLGEGAILQISKLSKIFDTGALNIASAINTIGAASEASESFQVDFLSRLSGIARTAQLAAPDLLAYGAALEINGQTVEVAGTALNTFLIDFVGNTEKFGKAAGYAKGELKQLLEEKGTNAAFLDFLTRLKAAAPTAEQLIQKLQELGVDGSRGANVFLTLANNIDLVKKQQEIATAAFAAGTSVIEEYNKKNNNTAADLEKLKKNISAIFTSDGFQHGVSLAISAANNFINALKGIPQFLSENRIAVLSMIAGLLLMNGTMVASAAAIVRQQVALLAGNVALRARNFLTSATISLQAAWIVVTDLLSARITIATGAQRLWNIAIASNPLGALLVVAGAVAAAISLLGNRTKELTGLQKVNYELNKRVAADIGEQISKTQYLTNIVKDNSISLDTRKKALAELIAINPAYLKGLSLENIATATGKKIIDDYVLSLQRKSREEAAAAIRSQQLQKDMQLALLQQSVEGKIANRQVERGDLSEEEQQFTGSNFFTRNSGSLTTLFTGKNTAERALEGIKEARGKIQEELRLTDEIIKKEFSELLSPDEHMTTTAKRSVTVVQRTVGDIKAEISTLEKSFDGLAAGDTKAIESNLANRKRLQAELDSLIGKSGVKEVHQAESLAAELKRIARDLTAYNESQYEKDVAAIDNKYAKLTQKARGNAELMKQVEGLKHVELTALNQKYFEEAAKLVNKAGAAMTAAQRKAREQQQEEVLKSATSAAHLLSSRMEGMASQLNRDRLAQKELAARKAGLGDQLKAQKDFLEEQKRQELTNAELTGAERANIEQKYRQARLEAELQFAQEVLNITTQFANAALSVFEGLSANNKQRDDNELTREKNKNEKQKAYLKNQLDAKLITRQQYDQRVGQLDKQVTEKEKKLKLQQFEREKTSNIIRANIQIAQAVLQALGSAPPPYNFVLAGIVAAAGAIQLLNIKNQEAPEFGDGGYLAHGPKHKSKSRGLPVVNTYTGKAVAFLEQGEGILNARTMADGKRYTVTGTPSQIASTLNKQGGGVGWTTDAAIKPFWRATPVAPMNLGRAKRSMERIRMMEFGGRFDRQTAVVQQAVQDAGNSNDATMEALALSLNNMSRTVSELQQTLSAGIIAKTSLTQHISELERFTNIQKEATFK